MLRLTLGFLVLGVHEHEWCSVGATRIQILCFFRARPRHRQLVISVEAAINCCVAYIGRYLLSTCVCMLDTNKHAQTPVSAGMHAHRHAHPRDSHTHTNAHTRTRSFCKHAHTKSMHAHRHARAHTHTHTHARVSVALLAFRRFGCSRCQFGLQSQPLRCTAPPDLESQSLWLYQGPIPHLAYQPSREERIMFLRRQQPRRQQTSPSHHQTSREMCRSNSLSNRCCHWTTAVAAWTTAVAA